MKSLNIAKLDDALGDKLGSLQASGVAAWLRILILAIGPVLVGASTG